MSPPARSLSDFLGAWALERRIVQADGQIGQFSGQARWRPEGDGAVYSEIGELTLAGHPPMRAERRYRWAADLTVWFEDGRFFHAVPPTGGPASHWCAPDRYDVRYDFGDWPVFRVTWEVRGPRKDYVMTSLFRPLEKPSG